MWPDVETHLIMSPELQRQRIAEACGWTDIIVVCGLPRGKDPRGWRRYGPSDTDPIARNDLPNYLSDLNAMNEAEKVLTISQLPAYFYWLRINVHPSNRLSDPIGWDWVCIHATAAQRAEAFLRTSGKWEETKAEPARQPA